MSYLTKIAEKYQFENQSNFVEDMEQGLLNTSPTGYLGIDEFEKLYEKKKLVLDTIDEYRKQNKTTKGNIQKARQRLYHIQQLTVKADRSSMIIKNQLEKVNDAHMMSKILMVEKMIKIKKQHDEMEKKKNQIFRIRSDKQKISMVNNSRTESMQKRLRQMSLIQSSNLRQFVDQKRHQTINGKKQLADRVRQQKSRRKQRLKRYEQFKIDIGKKNYMQKMEKLKENLEGKEKLLDVLYRDEVKEEKNYKVTQTITKEYLGSIFPTQTI